MEALAKPISFGYKKIILFFTGFGKFGKVLENPTTYLSRALEGLLQENPIDRVKLYKRYVITVSIEDCDEALKEIYAEINRLIEKEEHDGSKSNNHYVVLHMGVYQGSGKFNVEL